MLGKIFRVIKSLIFFSISKVLYNQKIKIHMLNSLRGKVLIDILGKVQLLQREQWLLKMFLLIV